MSDFSALEEDFNSMDKRLAVVETDVVYIKKTVDKLDKFVDDNRAGITTATALNSKIIAVILGGVVLAAVYVISERGGI